MQSLASTVSDAVSGPLNAFTSGVQQVASNISEAASNALNNFTSSIQRVNASVSDAVSGPLNAFTSGIQNVSSKISDAVSGPLSSFSSGVQQVASNVGNAVAGPFNRFINSIQSFASDISEAASGPLADFINGIKSLSSNVSDSASGPLNSFTSGMKNAFSSMGDMVTQTIASSNGISDFKDGLSNAVSGISDFIGGIGNGVQGLMNFGQQALSTAQNLLGPAESAETMKTAFVTLMGSTKAATDELSQLDTFASKTPFQTMDIDKAASQLIGFGVNAKDVVPDLTSIGDALSAVGKGSVANLDQVVGIFGKMQTSGKLTGQDMQQFSSDGINAWSILEKQTGKTQAQLQSMISAGLFPAKDAMSMLTKGIEANPLYSGGMAKQSATAAGLISTLQSNWNQLMVAFGTPILQALEGSLNDIGSALSSPAIKDFASSVGQTIVDVFKNIGNSLKSVDVKAFTSNVAHLGTQVSPIIASLKPVASSIFSSIGPILSTTVTDIGKFAKGLGDVIKFFKDGSGPAQVLSLAIGGVAAGLTAMKIAQFVAALPGLLASLGAWAAGQWAVAVPTLLTAGLFILVGIAVVAAVAGIVLAVKNWGAIAHWLQGVWGAIAAFFGWLWAQISGFFVGAGKWFSDRFTEAYKAVTIAMGGIGQWFQDRWKDIQGAFGSVGNWFHNVWQSVCDDFNSVLGGLGNLASNIWNSVTGAVKAGFNYVIDLVNNVISSIDSINVAGFGVNIPLIPHLASGIENFVGGIALVGEKGPELVNLPKGSSVLNANSTASLLQGKSNFKYPSMAGQAASSRQITVHVHPVVQPNDIHVDGKKLTDIIATHMANRIRMEGVRSR